MTMANYSLFAAALCSGTGNCVSTGIDVTRAAGDFAVGLAASTSNAAITVTYEVSQDGTNYDTATTSPTRTIVAGLAKSYKVVGFDIPLCKKLKVRCTGTGSNPASTTVTGTLMFTE